MIAINPTIIATMKSETPMRAKPGVATRAKTIHQMMSSETINPMMVKMKPTRITYAAFRRFEIMPLTTAVHPL